MDLNITIFLTLLLVAGVFLIIGYVFLRKKRTGKPSLIAGYIILLFLGFWVAIDGIYFNTGIISINETSVLNGNTTTVSTITTPQTITYPIINYSVGLTTILLGLLGLGIGMLGKDDEEE